MLRKVFFGLATLVVSLSGTIPVFAHGDQGDNPGAVYVLTNGDAGNEVIAFNRFEDGRYLYTLEAAASMVGAYQIGSDGSLLPLGTIELLPTGVGTQGIAVR